MLSRITDTLSTTLPLDWSDDQFSSDFDLSGFSTASSLYPDIPDTSFDLTFNDPGDFNQLENFEFPDDPNSLSPWPAPSEESYNLDFGNSFMTNELSQSDGSNLFMDPAGDDQSLPLTPHVPGHPEGTFPSDYIPEGTCLHWQASGYQEFLCCAGPVQFNHPIPHITVEGVTTTLSSSFDGCVRRTYSILQDSLYMSSIISCQWVPLTSCLDCYFF